MAKINKISGPLVIVEGLKSPMMNEIIKIKKNNLFGEIIRIFGENAMVQMYEPTTGLRPGMEIEQTGRMFTVELGPGLLKNVFDGIQRPLFGSSPYLDHGYSAKSLSREKKWEFKPNKNLDKSSVVEPGQVLGTCVETKTNIHKILVPPGIKGKLKSLVSSGKYTVDKVIAKVATKHGIQDLKMYHEWPVRKPRPYKKKLRPKEPISTGLRVVDFFFPAAQGGTIAIPGGFGTGKTQLIFQVIKYSQADVLVYIGCGERGNEVITVLDEISSHQMKNGRLEDRTVYIINTSNMPVAARTSGIFSGITIAEYYRDQGMNVVLLADSTTRWAEAMREISNRMGDFPGEEGYPTYLASEIGSFYERAGCVDSLSGEGGSITVIGTISLYGSDFGDPVAQSSMKVVSTLWALDPNLAYVRQYPAINRRLSYSKFLPFAQDSWEKIGDYTYHYEKILTILGKVNEIERLTAIMGKDMLSPEDQFLLHFNDLFTELFLKQSALNEHDAFRTKEEQFALADLMVKYYERGVEAIEKGIDIETVTDQVISSRLIALKTKKTKDYLAEISKLKNDIIFV